jgi:hypothetical protein
VGFVLIDINLYMYNDFWTSDVLIWTSQSRKLLAQRDKTEVLVNQDMVATVSFEVMSHYDLNLTNRNPC